MQYEELELTCRDACEAAGRVARSSVQSAARSGFYGAGRDSTEFNLTLKPPPT